LQSKHTHELVKHVWLLKSRDYHKSLMQRARKIISDARPIPGRSFNEQMDSISSPVALNVLSFLYNGKRIPKNRALTQFKKARAFDSSYIADLKATGFVTETKDSIQITPQGREYMKLYADGS